MTLIAGFRSREGGVLLCTDREEMDGYYSKRSVDKVYTLRLNQGRVYVAGAGAASIIIKAFLALKQALTEAEANGEDL